MLQQLQGAETRSGELDRFLLNMQTMAAHVNTKYDETERLRKQATEEAETLRVDLTRLTQKVAELTRECANRYSTEQVNEARRQATTENDGKLNTQRIEFQNLLNVSNAELTRNKGMLQVAQNELATSAIGVDSASAQAQFIRQLREKCEALANERDTYRRNTEDYVTQLSRSDETVQQLSAEHYDQMAAARHENRGLKSETIAATDVQKHQLVENTRLTSTVTQLREEINAQNVNIESMNLNTEDWTLHTSDGADDLNGGAI